jgi:signal transduction histidine kinase
MGDSLYKALPDNMKPADRHNLSAAETKNLLMRAGLFPQFRQEMARLALRLEQENRHAARPERIMNYRALTAYYVSESNIAKVIAFTDSSIRLIGDDTTRTRLLAEAMLYKGQALIYQQKEEQAAELFNQAMVTYKRLNDSMALGNLHNFQMVLYSSLNLFEQSINEARQAFSYLYPSLQGSEFLDHQYYNYHLEVANSYLNWYEDTRDKKHADSSEKHVRYILDRSYEEAGQWYAYAYFLKGCLAFLRSDYTGAVTCFDTSLSPALAHNDRASDLNPVKKIYKGMSLLGLGKSREGRKMILENLEQGVDLNTEAVLSYYLYRDAEQREDWKEALKWHINTQRLEDSMKVMSQRGKVFEITQKYMVSEKEAQIKNLELINLNQAEQKKNILLWTSLIILVLISVVAGLYSLSRKRELRAMKASRELEQERRKVEELMIRQDREMMEEKTKAITELKQKISRDMHDGISSALVGIKYYINHRRRQEKEPRVLDLMQELEEEVNSVYIQMREYMHGLNEDLEKVVQDFGSFLLTLARQFSDPGGFQVDLRVDIEELKARLNDNQKNEMNLIVKEALANTMKHAWATRLTLVIEFNEQTCSFRIEDNGRGFTVAIKEKGLGLESIRTRLQLLNGELEIRSVGEGTTLRGTFPLAA